DPVSAAAKAATGSFCHWSALRPSQKATMITAGLRSAVSSTLESSTGATGTAFSPAASAGRGGVVSRLAFQLVAQLLLLVLDEPADHLPPQRLGEIGRHTLVGGPRPHLVDHLLVEPRHIGLGAGLQLELPGALH